ncbi:hypothetical protein [Chitinimonas naiadis]
MTTLLPGVAARSNPEAEAALQRSAMETRLAGPLFYTQGPSSTKLAADSGLHRLGANRPQYLSDINAAWMTTFK